GSVSGSRGHGEIRCDAARRAPGRGIDRARAGIRGFALGISSAARGGIGRKRIMEAFRFYSPLCFLVAPLALACLWWAHHPRRRAAAIFSSLADLKNLPVTIAQR